MKVGIIHYDAGNIASVKNALMRLQSLLTLEIIISNRPSELGACEKLIFPGVGSAKAAMEALQKHHLISFLRSTRQPCLGICLGMQLLFAASEEGETPGLGILPGTIKKFPKKVGKIPHMGWNAVHIAEGYKDTTSLAFHHFHAYFVHSYYAPLGNFTLFTTTYGGITFSSGVRYQHWWGVQFHPEKSGSLGEQFLYYFLTTTNETAA